MKYVITYEQYDLIRTALVHARVSLNCRRQEQIAHNTPTEVTDATIATVATALKEVNLGTLPVAKE